MCYIIFNKNNNKFNLENLKKAFEWNHHGVGISFTKDNQINVLKFYNDVLRTGNNDQISNWFDQVIKPSILSINNDTSIKNVTIHFRRSGSSWSINSNNVHPFHIKNDIYLFHNGTFVGEANPETQEIDTFVVSKWLRDKMNYLNIETISQFKDSKLFSEFVNKCGSGSRCILVSNNDYCVCTTDTIRNTYNSNKDVWQSASDIELLDKMSY